MAEDIHGNTVLNIANEQLPELVKAFSRDITLTPTLMAKAVNSEGISDLEYAAGDIKELIDAGLKITSVADLEIWSELGTVLYLAIEQNCLKELVSAFGYGVKISEEMLVELVKGEWFYETRGRSDRALETIYDYLPSFVLELESSNVVGVVQDPVAVDAFA